LSIGHGQTISQPYIVAFMTQALRLGGGERVLEIGTGLGYQAAVLSRIASEVYSVEYLSELAEQARGCLSRLNYSNVNLKVDDGSEGWPEHSPYNAIIVTASGPSVPQTLKDQLAVGGRLVIPVGNYRFGQYILRLTKGYYGDFQEERLLDVAFVPLRGKYGWNDA
ncbi:MAG: protein-L-isoaspartate(D-aspartate) O-methyltransferase, partial [Thermodesulfobacteriota bacterium]